MSIYLNNWIEDCISALLTDNFHKALDFLIKITKKANITSINFDSQNFNAIYQGYNSALERNEIESDAFLTYLKQKKLEVLKDLLIALQDDALETNMLHHAVRFSNMTHAILDRLYCNHPFALTLHIHARNVLEGTALHEAARLGHVTSMIWLVNQGADIHAKNEYFEETPLHSAVNSGNIESIKYLLKCGANIDAKDKAGETALYKATVLGHYGLICYLLKQNADVNAQTRQGEIPLHAAARIGRIKIIKKLLRYGSKINKQQENGFSPLHYYVTEGFLNYKNNNIFKLFIKYGVFLYLPNHDGTTPMHETMNMVTYLSFAETQEEKSVQIQKAQEALYKFLIACTREREGFLETQTYSDGMVELFQRLEHTEVMGYIQNPDFTSLPFFTINLACRLEDSGKRYDLSKKKQNTFRNRLLGLPDELMRLLFLEVLIQWIHETQDTNIPDIESAKRFHDLEQLVNLYDRKQKPCDAKIRLTS